MMAIMDPLGLPANVAVGNGDPRISVLTTLEPLSIFKVNLPGMLGHYPFCRPVY